MSQGGLSLYDVGAFLDVSHHRAHQMFREGKLPEPTEHDASGRPRWKPTTIERWAEREWWDTRRWRERPQRR